MTIRHTFAQLLEPDTGTPLSGKTTGDTKSGAWFRRIGRWIDFGLIALILLSVIAFMLETDAGFKREFTTELWWLERVVVVVFSIEYLFRCWIAPELLDYQHLRPWKARLKWMTSPMGLIDLAAILPFYLALFITLDASTALLLRAARLLRIFKLTRYSPALRILKGVISKEAPTLGVIMMLLFVLLVFSSWAMYVFENEAQPDAFASIPQAMWWAIVSLTTVGYGDVVPVTNGGRLFAGLIALMGVGVVALPAGILASGFSNELNRRNSTYEDALDKALSDGALDKDELKTLHRLREHLGISDEEANSLLEQAERRLGQHAEASKCPHCGKSLGRQPEQDGSK